MGVASGCRAGEGMSRSAELRSTQSTAYLSAPGWMLPASLSSGGAKSSTLARSQWSIQTV